MDVDDDEVLGVLTGLLADNTGTKPTVSGCDWSSTFRIHRRLAATYRRGHVLLAGDAAHIHSPFGGQGMNTGLGDAENLAWKLGLVVRGLAGESLLDTYEAERRPVAQEVLASTSSLTGLVLGGSAVARVLRDRVLVPLMNSPRVQRLIWEQASQLKVSYRSGPARCPLVATGTTARRPDRRCSGLHRRRAGRPGCTPNWELPGGRSWPPPRPPVPACAAVARRLLGADRVTVLVPADPSGRVQLVRPDAHLAWSGSDPESLTRWLIAALDATRRMPGPAGAANVTQSAPQSLPDPVGVVRG